MESGPLAAQANHLRQVVRRRLKSKSVDLSQSLYASLTSNVRL